MNTAAKRNPFGDDDDNNNNNNNRFGNRYNNDDSNEELKRIQEQIGHVENESLSSTQRALRALNEAEEVGVKTAEELVNQGEKLQNIEESMDGVNEKLNSTQKNLNQLKGFFGGMKAKFSRNKDGSKSSQNIVTKSKPETSSSASKETSMRTSSSQGAVAMQASSQPAQFATITGSDREVELNKNLDAISSGLGRLKNLGLDMQRELDRQDPLINRITQKSENTHARIENQNTQMKKILK